MTTASILDAQPGARPQISRGEVEARQQQLRSLAESLGWPGVVVAGRGGGTFDRHGDLLWCCGHYQAFPFLRDRPPSWSGRAHALLAVPVDGPVALLISAPEHDPDAVVADRVVVASGDFADQARQLIEPLRGGGLCGGDALPWALGARLGLDAFIPADDDVERLRRRKTVAELEVLRHVCAAGTRSVEALMAAAVPGATEGAAVAAAVAAAAEAGALPYLVALATGERSVGYTGRPMPGFRAERPLQAGELARLDLALVYEGYYCDFGRTWSVGGAPDAETAALLDGLRTGLEGAIAAATSGVTAGDGARAGAAALPPGLSTAYPPHWGHGLGVSWEGPWLVEANDEALEAGVALAVEVAVHDARGRTAAAEQDVIVTDGAPELLTPAAWAAGP